MSSALRLGFEGIEYPILSSMFLQRLQLPVLYGFFIIVQHFVQDLGVSQLLKDGIVI